VLIDRNGPTAPEIDELRPTEAAVGIRRSRYARKIKIKNCQSPYVALVREEGGARKLFWQKVKDYARVRSGGRVLAAESDNKPIRGNGGAVFFVSGRVGTAEFDNGIGNTESSWY